MEKVYLGDAVYAEIDRGMVKLTVNYGRGPTETIYLEPEVLKALHDWLESLSKEPGHAE